MFRTFERHCFVVVIGDLHAAVLSSFCRARDVITGNARLGFETAIITTLHGDYTISTDRARLDLASVHGFLSRESHWARGVDAALLARAIAGSLPIGAYAGDGALAGFARVVTDGSLFAYLRDVFVLADHRGKGLGRALAAAALAHPDLASVSNWMLATNDAHGVYRALGFAPVANPGIYMQKRNISG